MPVGSIELVTKSEYARRRGCSETAVRRAVSDGRITLIDGKIDPVAADAQWARNTRVRAGSRPADDANLTAGGPSSGVEGSRDDPDSYWSLKAEGEKTRNEMDRMKLAELQGQLIRSADVRATWSKRTAGLREAILQIPARLAAVMAAETDQAKCHDILQAELHAVLQQVTDA